jgi:NADPH:quinone reductase-like Zn-dependent oxidoreductase
MRAWTYSKAGPPSTVLTLRSDIPLPTLKTPNDVLVRVSHTALHPGSSIIMQLCPSIFRASPAIPETEFSGTVISTGCAVAPARELIPGTRVFGSVLVGPHVRTGVGALAEWLVVDAGSVARMPGRVGLEEMAGLAVSGCTALALMERAGLKLGDGVLVNGASGGIGHMVVQLAKRAVGESGRVVAICSEINFEMVKSLGADEVSWFLSLSRFDRQTLINCR